MLYRLLTRSLVVSPLLMPLAMLGRASRGRGTERFEPVLWASHLESALRSRGWIWRGADMVGRVVVFLRRSDKPFLSSDMVRRGMVSESRLQWVVEADHRARPAAPVHVDLRSSRGPALSCLLLERALDLRPSAAAQAQKFYGTEQHLANHNNTPFRPRIPS